MDEDETIKKYGLTDREVPSRILKMALPYHFGTATFSKFPGYWTETFSLLPGYWNVQLHNGDVLPGEWASCNFCKETLEEAVDKVREFVYGCEKDDEEPSLLWLWNHGFTEAEDHRSYSRDRLVVSKKEYPHGDGGSKRQWRCQYWSADGLCTKGIKARTVREAVELVCKTYGLEMPE